MNLKGLPLFEEHAAPPKSPQAPEAPKEKSVPFTVSELTQKIRGTLEPAFSEIWVRGEVSNYKPAASGHVYFSLKDSGASISAAIFNWGKRRVRFDLKDGLEVVCHGKISVYPPRGGYQIIIDHIEPLGAGALQLAFEQLKAKLEKEGLFETERKKKIPNFPKTVVVITSPTGAAIQDILNVLGRRAPHIHVKIIPALVQGETAPAQLIRALDIANQHRLGDLILLARGGGSIEDLWAFNDEMLARKIASSALPVVSAVGHEIDFTISDFVSDLRAPTPSAGAEMISQNWVNVLDYLQEISKRLGVAIKREFVSRGQLLTHLSARLINPKDRIREQTQRCDDLFLRLEQGVRRRFERKRMFFEQLIGQLNALSPLQVLERGYTLVRDGKDSGKIIKRARDIQVGQKLEITFHDGSQFVEAIRN